MGNATKKAPSQGFDDPGLATVFSQHRVSNATSPPGNDWSLSTGAKAGIGLSAGIGACLLLTAIAFYRCVLPQMNHPWRRKGPVFGKGEPAKRRSIGPEDSRDDKLRNWNWIGWARQKCMRKRKASLAD
jgi:hypothetical protein